MRFGAIFRSRGTSITWRRRTKGTKVDIYVKQSLPLCRGSFNYRMDVDIIRSSVFAPFACWVLDFEFDALFGIHPNDRAAAKNGTVQKHMSPLDAFWKTNRGSRALSPGRIPEHRRRNRLFPAKLDAVNSTRSILYRRNSFWFPQQEKDLNLVA